MKMYKFCMLFFVMCRYRCSIALKRLYYQGYGRCLRISDASSSAQFDVGLACPYCSRFIKETCVNLYFLPSSGGSRDAFEHDSVRILPLATSGQTGNRTDLGEDAVN